jgi:DOPA 4,5-dioxygenase
MSAITGYHAHVYFDTARREQAAALCAEAGRRFNIAVGRMHDKPIGPHPSPSCQLAFSPERFSEVMQWLVTARGGLTVFAHAVTGDEMKDHTEHVIWLGPSETINLNGL